MYQGKFDQKKKGSTLSVEEIVASRNKAAAKAEAPARQAAADTAPKKRAAAEQPVRKSVAAEAPAEKKGCGGFSTCAILPVLVCGACLSIQRKEK